MYFKRSLLLNLSPVLLPGKSHGQRNLVGFSPWGREESDTTEWLHFHFSLSCIGEGNGNPLQCCLENPRDSRAWWAAIYGVTQSQTRLKQLNSNSSMHSFPVVRYCRPLSAGVLQDLLCLKGYFWWSVERDVLYIYLFLCHLDASLSLVLILV